MTTFRELHIPGKPFILANAWDGGSAKLLAAMGAKAIASTSAGHAFTIGAKDMGDITRDQSLAHCADLVAATPLPVSGDLENGYGDNPDDVAKTILQAGAIGLAGACIEDEKFDANQAYDFATSVQRIEAGVQAARSLNDDFVLAARADGIMNGHYDTAEAIRRLQAYEAAGADVLYAPMPASMDDLAEICKAVSIPVNALAAGPFTKYSVSDFANIGVARISFGAALARVTHTAIVNSAKQMFEDGEFSSLSDTLGGEQIEAMFDEFN